MHPGNSEATQVESFEVIGKLTVGRVFSDELPAEPLSHEVLERFAGMPNRKQALRAKDAEDLTIFLSHVIARKLYTCPCCHEDIQIGSDHVVVDRIQATKAHSRHHVDANCVQNFLLPRLTALQIISPQEASLNEVNRRARRYRHRRRK